MTDPAVTRLLREVFSRPVAREFIVLRNAEELPDALTGTDLDVTTVRSGTAAQVVDGLEQAAAAAGWTMASRSVRRHMTAVAFVHVDNNQAAAIHFDVFDGITWFGLPLVSPEQLDAEAFDDDHGVRQLTRRGQSLATVVHHLAWNGGLEKQKYRDEVAEVLADPNDGPWLRDHIRTGVGEWGLREIEAGNLGEDRPQRRKELWSRLIKDRASESPTSVATAAFGYLGGQVQSFIQPPGIIGERGAPVGDRNPVALDLDVACGVSPHAFEISEIGDEPSEARTVNGPRYEKKLAQRLERTRLLRKVAPSLYLWVQAKRGYVVVLDELPSALRWLHKTRNPSWIRQRRERTA